MSNDQEDLPKVVKTEPVSDETPVERDPLDDVLDDPDLDVVRTSATWRKVEKDSGKKKGKKESSGKKKSESIGSNRGVETMFRTSYREKLEMTALADTKANIMISVNGLIMSIMLASSAFLSNADAWLLYPCLALMLGSVVSITFAVLAVRPRVTTKSRATAQDVRNDRANILFFGDFGSITEEEFLDEMREMLRDQGRLYYNMARQLYGIGRGLNRKFRLLKLSYTVFLLALFTSVGIFLLGLAVSAGGSSEPEFVSSQSELPIFEDWWELEGVWEPSAAHQLPDGRIIIGEDEYAQALLVLDPSVDGRFTVERLQTPGEILDDLEGLAVDDRGYVYAIMSLSPDSAGNRVPARERLVRFRLQGSEVVDFAACDGIRQALANAHPILARAATFTESEGLDYLNVEGLAFDSQRGRLLIGFRTPVPADGTALLAAIENPDDIFERGEAPSVGPELIHLDLGGGSVRGMAYDSRLGGYLVLARVEDHSVDERPFTLWLWTGGLNDPPNRVRVPVLDDDLRHAEAVAPILYHGSQRILLASDEGNFDDAELGQYVLLDYGQIRLNGD